MQRTSYTRHTAHRQEGERRALSSEPRYNNLDVPGYYGDDVDDVGQAGEESEQPRAGRAGGDPQRELE